MVTLRRRGLQAAETLGDAGDAKNRVCHRAYFVCSDLP
jgi:hypothetical protein